MVIASEGQYVDGKMEGQGTFTFGDDNASWEGMWISDSAIGIGTWHFDCDGPTSEGTGQLHFNGDGPTNAETEARAAPAKWAQVAAETAAAAQQEALIESKPPFADDDGADDGGGGGSGDDDDDDDGDGTVSSVVAAVSASQCEPPIADSAGDGGDDDDDDDESDTTSSVVTAVPASPCELPIAEPQPTHDAANEGERARRCHQCSARKTRAGAKLKLKWCSACMCARYCSEECQAADWREHKSACREHCAAQQQS